MLIVFMFSKRIVLSVLVRRIRPLVSVGFFDEEWVGKVIDFVDWQKCE